MGLLADSEIVYAGTCDVILSCTATFAASPGMCQTQSGTVPSGLGLATQDQH